MVAGSGKRAENGGSRADGVCSLQTRRQNTKTNEEMRREATDDLTKNLPVT